MISKIRKFVSEHKKEVLVTMSLGLTFTIGVNFNVNCSINFNLKNLVFVYTGYQVLKQITKFISKKIH